MSTEARVLSGRYRIDEIIGRGGMASVYRGRDLTLDRPVAIKLLKRELAADASFRTRFRLEAQAASRMSHPTIVRVYDAGEDSETDPDGSVHPVPYIVMELVEGRLLKQVIADGPLSEDAAVRYADGILEALEYSHRAGVVHRDIKPGNVMVTTDGQVKVMDFGIARAVSDSSSTVAETTTIIGTASYFSPEQAKGEPVDARADLYSAGVVLFELLTGEAPFRGDSAVAVAYQHVSEAPRAPSEVREGITPAMDALVLRALAKDPQQRFQSAGAFREVLAARGEGKGPSKRQIGALSNELYGADPRQAAETARSLRQLSTDTTMRRTQSGPPVMWVWAGIIVLAVLLISVFIWVVSIQPGGGLSSNAREVPDVVDVSWDRAESELLSRDLVPVRTDASSSEIAEGNVISTNPTAGTTVTPNQEITVVVSTGHETTTMPDVTTMSRDEAAAALETAGLELGTVQRRNDPDTEADRVLEASTSAGAPVSPGDEIPTGQRINLVVATGTVVVRDLTRTYTYEAAAEILQADDLQLTAVRAEDDSCAADDDLVIAQDRVGEVPIHAEVTLTVCTGS